MTKSSLNNDAGSMIIELIFVLVGAIMPILLAATSLAQVLEARSRLELITREASRSFALAKTNQAGFSLVDQLQQRQILATSVKLELTCEASCVAGSNYQVTGTVKHQVLAIPYLPDITLNLNSTVVAQLDRYLER